MSLWRQISNGLRVLIDRRAADEDVADEVRHFLDEAAAESVTRGLSPEEARRAAKLEVGNMDAVREQIREAGWENVVGSFFADVRYGLRMLRKSPGFTAVAVLTLALGIGANTAVFSLVNWLVLRPLPLDHPSEVIFLERSWKDGSTGTQFSYPDFRRIQQQTSSIFFDVSADQMFQMDGLSVEGKSEPMLSNYVAGNFFSVLGITPALGRLILPVEGKVAGADPVLVLGYSYWKSRFDSDPGVVGKKVSVNGHPMTIVGIAPKNFPGLATLLDTQGYMPLAMAATVQDAPQDFLADAKNSSLRLIARLKPGMTLATTEAVLNVVAQRLSEPNHGQMTIHALRLGPVSLVTGPAVRPQLNLVSSLFLILAGAVLVLACMNIANLCLVRVAARHREMAVRSALGAARSRLIRQLLTESSLLAMFGCVAGIALGIAASRLFGSISLHTALPVVLDFRFDWRVFTYTLAAATLTAILVGITPALRISRTNLSEILHETARTTAGGRQRLRSAFVAAQVGGALMLLIVAGLFVRSMQKVQHSDLGFDPSHVLNVSTDPHEAGYQEAQGRQFQKLLLDRARALPGVTSASIALCVPMGYESYYSHLKIDGYQPRAGEDIPAAGFNAVAPGYFETMRIPLVQGRDFRDSDDEASPRVAIVNQNFADMYWRGQNPIGRHFSTTVDTAHPIEVIGVTRNSRDSDIFTNNDPFFYVPLAQHYYSVTTLQLRTGSAPEAHAPEVVALIHSLEPAMPVFDVQAMTTVLEGLNGFLLFHFAAALAGSFGILGLALALVGVYGVVSYASGRRTHEIGIRMACGAQPRQILEIILRSGLAVVGVGLAVGVIAAAGLATLVGHFLFGVAPLDPLTYVAASFLLSAIAVLACYVPAHRAMRVDPMVALRYE